MSKKLRPRRGAEDAAIQEDILLEEGEIFMEFQTDRGEGYGPGRLIVGNGSSRYNEKVNNTNDPTEFQPFMTDPQIYVPIYDDSEPKPQDPEKYSYEDTDRGYTKLKNDLLMGIRKLPETIGIIKEVLCRHTDNLRYDNDRITNLENQLDSSNILDIMSYGYIYNTADTFIREFPISIDENSSAIPEGYTFYKWESVAVPLLDNYDSALELRPGVVENVLSNQTKVHCISRHFLPKTPYRIFCYFIKKKAPMNQ